MKKKILHLFLLYLSLVGCSVSKAHFLDEAKSKGTFCLTSVLALEKNLGESYRYIGSDEKFHYLIYHSTGWRYGPYRFKVPLGESTVEASLDFKTNTYHDADGYLQYRDYIDGWHP